MAAQRAGAKATTQSVPTLPAPAPELYEAASELASRAPLPARVGRVRFGATGWSDAALSRAELFYPKQVNNCVRNYATLNAKGLAALVSQG